MGKNIHVVKNPSGGWSTKQENAQRSSGNFDTQKEAIQKAIQIARNKNQEVVIHGENGKIRQKNSYGNDSYPPEG